MQSTETRLALLEVSDTTQNNDIKELQKSVADILAYINKGKGVTLAFSGVALVLNLAIAFKVFLGG